MNNKNIKLGDIVWTTSRGTEKEEIFTNKQMLKKFNTLALKKELYSLFLGEYDDLEVLPVIYPETKITDDNIIKVIEHLANTMLEFHIIDPILRERVYLGKFKDITKNI